MKKVILSVCLGSFVLLLTLAALMYPKKTWLEKDIVIPNMAELPYKSEWNFRQSKNACGPYSAAAVVRQLTSNEISSETISRATPWRYHGYTLPFGVVQVIRNQGLSVNELIVTGSDKDKIAWVHAQIAQQKPVIILGRKNGLLHYVTLLGFRQNQFTVYDSLEERGASEMTIDKNDTLPGNTNWTNDELLAFWSQGGVVGLYRYYAIVTRSE